jgi:hypothetical protein
MLAMRIIFLGILLAGCPAPRSQCDRNAQPAVELRDGKGLLLVSARPGEKGLLDVCDGNFQRTGTIKLEGATATLFDRGGAPRLNLRKNGPDDFEGSTADNVQTLRVHRQGAQLHVMEPSGVRLGTLTEGPPAGIYDSAQVPQGTVEPRGNDQAIRDPDGATLFLVQPAKSPQLAGVFWLPRLDQNEKLALYLILSR